MEGMADVTHATVAQCVQPPCHNDCLRAMLCVVAQADEVQSQLRLSFLIDSAHNSAFYFLPRLHQFAQIFYELSSACLRKLRTASVQHADVSNVLRNSAMHSSPLSLGDHVPRGSSGSAA